ncbi:MAG: hypothetical protein ACOYOB_12350 [Myxococcota bacterium]
MRLTIRRAVNVWVLAALAAGAGGCAAEFDPGETGLSAEEAEFQQNEALLTSNTAAFRDLTFTGYVFVDPSASQFSIIATVKKQTQSAFGALRESYVAVNSRELGDVDPLTFVKVPVTVIDTKIAGDKGKSMLRVAYTYKDKALVPKVMAQKSSLSLGLLNGNYQLQAKKILVECTSNDAQAKEFESAIWYVFDPSKAKCKATIAAEQKLVDVERAKIVDKKTQVAKLEVDRLYIPMTVQLKAAVTSKGLTYPEYDQLWSGGVQKGRLVVATVYGMMADWAVGEQKSIIDDEGYVLWLEHLNQIFKARPGFKLASLDPVEDLSTVTVGTKKVTGITFQSLINWELYNTGFPSTVLPAQRKALRLAAAKKVYQHWLRFELPVQVKVGKAAAATVILTIDTYFGAGSSSGPHKKAIKNSDVFLYNGHSYIGYGPLDPGNFTTADFPTTYQLMFVDACVSYNYYEKDYFLLKTGGSAKLDMITNGLETWVAGSGVGMGNFIVALLNGKQTSYKDLLTAAEASPDDYEWGGDALRVVDGEIDNKYKPKTTPIVVTP